MVTGATRSTSTSLVWLGHPVTVLALVVLVVNDHLLKAAHPGLLTGKLSDVAGMVLAPPLVAAVAALIAPRLPSRGVALGAIAAVGATFTIVKSSGYGARLASDAWSLLWDPSLVRADPTDLIALPALAIAWWAWTRARRADAVPARWVRALRIGVLLPLALVGVAATSPAREATAERVVATPDAVYLVAQDAGGMYGETWTRSTDSGRTWQPVPDADTDVLREQFPTSLTQACSARQPRTCYRVEPERFGVQRTDDGGATWEMSLKPRRGIAVDEPVSTSVAVQDVDGGHLVVVANGTDGFAVRDAAGAWDRVGFPGVVGQPPSPAEGDDDRAEGSLVSLIVGLALALATITVGAAAMLSRRGGTAQWWWLPAHQVVTIPVLLGLVAVEMGSFPSSVVIWVVAPMVALVSLVTAVLGVTFALADRHAGARWAIGVLLAGMVTFVLAGMALQGWWVGRPPTALGAGLALLAAIPGTVAAVWASRRTRTPER